MNPLRTQEKIPQQLRNSDRVYPDGVYQGTTVHVNTSCPERLYPGSTTAKPWTAVQAYLYLMPRWCKSCVGGGS